MKWLLTAALVSAGVWMATPAHADCMNGQVLLAGDTYVQCDSGTWVHLSPTFDPSSADGYGPNQPLPPLCIRFPDDYTC